ncbi:outer membrane protein [Sphingomonas qilianensis]|uniref:Outer membrane beta-barrel protein n=1 Tax=Sphingomonas qilianensis TaxID=1736690 RepID=A0ABU9XP73_9SPHN
MACATDNYLAPLRNHKGEQWFGRATSKGVIKIMRKFVIAAALLAASTAGVASAQDSTSSNGTTFRGIRVEGQVGGDRFQSQGTHNDSFGYGGLIGFDGTIGDRFVIGAEGTLWNPDDTENCVAAGVNGSGTLCQKSFQEYGVAVRAGVLVTPQLLVYGKGGFVNNEQRKSFTGSAIAAPAGGGNLATGVGGYYDHFNTDGYQVGGGVEYSLTDQFYVNGEYKFSQYSDNTSRQRALIGVGFRFK